MLGDLLFSLNRVLPFFLLIVFGALVVRGGKLSEDFFQHLNRFVYGLALPVNLFHTVARREEGMEVSPGFLAFTAVATLVAFLLIWLLTEIVYRHDKAVIGTLVQGAFRGNFALLGASLAGAVGGPPATQKAALALIVVVPMYNVLSVTVLTLRGTERSKPNLRKLIKGIVSNPLILSVVCALPFFFLRIQLPYFLDTTLDYIGRTATPLGLLSIGGLFNWKDATARLRPALYATGIKILLQPALGLPLGYLLGFRGEELLVLFVLFASPCAVSCYPMADALGGDAPLASNILILTTFFSGFVFAVGIYLMRTLGLI